MQQPNIPAVSAPTDLANVRLGMVINNQLVSVPAAGLGSAFGFQPLDADLTSWAAITRASGFDTFVATPSSANLRALLTDETGTGAAYFAGGNIGTPSAGVATNLTGLPISTGVSGLGANVTTFLATPSSANLAAALTDESGTGVVPFHDSATFTPSFSATGATFSYSLRAGAYTKIGRMVFFDLTILLNTSGNTLTANALTITGLPFTAGAIGAGIFPVRWDASTTSYVAMTARVSTTTLVLEGATAAATANSTAVLCNGALHATNGSAMRVIGNYFV